MLYAASIRVRFSKINRRIDVIIEADDLEKAKEKALKQARKIYTPDKKATYSIIGIINEVEAFDNFFAQLDKADEEPTS
jgi:hypothetical protein